MIQALQQAAWAVWYLVATGVGVVFLLLLGRALWRAVVPELRAAYYRRKWRKARKGDTEHGS